MRRTILSRMLRSADRPARARGGSPGRAELASGCGNSALAAVFRRGAPSSDGPAVRGEDPARPRPGRPAWDWTRRPRTF